MQALTYGAFVLCPKKLRNHDGSAGGQPGKKADDQVDNLGGRPSYTCKGFFTHKVSDNNRVNCIIKLLEKGSEYNRKKEQKKLPPDDSFCDLIYI